MDRDVGAKNMKRKSKTSPQAKNKYGQNWGVEREQSRSQLIHSIVSEGNEAVARNLGQQLDGGRYYAAMHQARIVVVHVDSPGANCT